MLSESWTIVAVVLLLLGVGIRLASRHLSYLKLTCALIAGQVAMHSVLAVAANAPSDGSFWAELADFVQSAWTSGLPDVGSLLPGEVTIALIQAAVFCVCRRSIWTWFRLAAIRLIQLVQRLAGPAIPNVPGISAYSEQLALRPLLITGSCGRRAPPARGALNDLRMEGPI